MNDGIAAAASRMACWNPHDGTRSEHHLVGVGGLICVRCGRDFNLSDARTDCDTDERLVRAVAWMIVEAWATLYARDKALPRLSTEECTNQIIKSGMAALERSK